MENVSHKRRSMELEGEIKQLSGHQNLHQRIHHHAKIKARISIFNTFNSFEVRSQIAFSFLCSKIYMLRRDSSLTNRKKTACSKFTTKSLARSCGGQKLYCLVSRRNSLAFALPLGRIPALISMKRDDSAPDWRLVQTKEFDASVFA